MFEGLWRGHMKGAKNAKRMFGGMWWGNMKGAKNAKTWSDTT